MTTEEIVDAIRIATNNTFIADVCTRTCMGWAQTYDKYGRPLNCDPNYTNSSIVIDDIRYGLITCGWKIWVIKPEYVTATNYCTLMSNTNNDSILYYEDRTPDYIKEYHNQKREIIKDTSLTDITANISEGIDITLDSCTNICHDNITTNLTI